MERQLDLHPEDKTVLVRKGDPRLAASGDDSFDEEEDCVCTTWETKKIGGDPGEPEEFISVCVDCGVEKPAEGPEPVEIEKEERLTEAL